MMAIEDRVQYWIKISDDDLSAGATLLQGGHYLYVGFMCHQATEKILKAWYTKAKEDTPPYTHDFFEIARKGGFEDQLSDNQKDFMDELHPLNIEARYPSYKNAVAKTLTKQRCIYLLEQSKKFQQWIKETILLR